MTRQQFVNLFYDVCNPDATTKQDVVNEWHMWLDALDEEGEVIDTTWLPRKSEIAFVLKMRQGDNLPVQYLEVPNAIEFI